MRKYVRKYTNCLICGIDIKRGKYCLEHRAQGYRNRSKSYHKWYYQIKKGNK